MVSARRQRPQNSRAHSYWWMNTDRFDKANWVPSPALSSSSRSCAWALADFLPSRFPSVALGSTWTIDCRASQVLYQVLSGLKSVRTFTILWMRMTTKVVRPQLGSAEFMLLADSHYGAAASRIHCMWKVPGSVAVSTAAATLWLRSFIETAHPMHATSWRRFSVDRGLSLPELLVTITLALLILTIAAPIFSRVLQAFELRGAEQHISAELQRTRMAAVMENRRYRWELVNDRRYLVSRYDSAAGEWQPVQETDVEEGRGSVTMAATDSIVFAPNGGAPTHGTVTLTTPDGAIIRVTVGPSGSVHAD